MASISSEEIWASFEQALTRATQVGPRIVEGSEELNKGCYHILRLLLDSALLFRESSWATATFLAITALEETAKVHIGIFRQPSSLEIKRSKDPLYSHRDKHLLAVTPTIQMGSRLGKAIGEQRVTGLIKLAMSGDLNSLRESCMYVNKTAGKLQIPEEEVSKETARELLLFAIEAFDDALVGYTNYSFIVGKRTDELFEEIANV